MSDAPVINTVLRSREEVDAVVRKLSRHIPGSVEGRYLQVSMWWWKPEASLSQKNLAQAWCGLMARHAGYTHGEMWAALCEQLLGTVEIVDPIARKPRVTYRSSTSLTSREEWQQFLDGIRRLADEHFGLKLPASKDPRAWQSFRNISRVRTDEEKR